MVIWFAVFMILLKLTNLYKEGSSQALVMLCNRTEILDSRWGHACVVLSSAAQPDEYFVLDVC